MAAEDLVQDEEHFLVLWRRSARKRDQWRIIHKTWGRVFVITPA
jgi:hypothetical protein